MQTKLTEGQIGNCRNIIYLLDKGDLSFVWWNTEEGSDYWAEVVTKLREKIHHRTSDGKPYVEPEPPIPEGWRKAEPDEWRRRDVKFWKSKDKIWLLRAKSGPFDQLKTGTRYIVPIDPPLTDEDACVWPRLLVMVRNKDYHAWEGPFQYVGRTTVDDDDIQYSVWDKRGYHRWYAQARRATPEEIEAAR